MNPTPGSITFFYPSYVIGGTELLFVRLAEHLTENYGFEIHVIDYKNGALSKLLKDSDANLIEFNPGRKTVIEKDTVIIMPLPMLYQIASKLFLTPTTKLFFWSVHPYSMVDMFPVAKLVRNIKAIWIKRILKCLFPHKLNVISRVFKKLNETNSVVFMDKTNFEINRVIFDLRFTPDYLPIPVSAHSTASCGHFLVDEKEINIGWLGRLDEFKIQPLILAIDNSIKYSQANGIKVNMHVIGTGNKESLLSGYINSDKINLIKLGTLVGNELNQYLINNVDVMFAMGTSCLDCSLLKLPSILIDFSYNKINSNKYKFRWMYESKYFSLGENICELEQEHQHTFGDVMQVIYSQRRKAEIGLKCFEYVNLNHSIDSIAESFIKDVTESSCYLGNITSTSFYNFGIFDKLLLLYRDIKTDMVSRRDVI